MPRTIAFVVSSRLSTYYELSTKLGAEDLYDLMEILAVDNHNQDLMSRQT